MKIEKSKNSIIGVFRGFEGDLRLLLRLLIQKECRRVLIVIINTKK